MFYSQVSSWLPSQNKAEAGCTLVTLSDPEQLEIGGLGKVTLLSAYPPIQSQPRSVFIRSSEVIFLNSVSRGLMAKRLLQKVINFHQVRWQGCLLSNFVVAGHF